MTEAQKNANRFKGFANLYNAARPTTPQYILDVLTRYLGHNPQTVVDIGCGTGLSSFIWSSISDKVIGIEPSEGMIGIAIENAKDYPNVQFIKAFADNTGIDDNAADIITCSQSFHWMEPKSALKEINRILKPGGVFAVYDYDGSPVINADVEIAYGVLYNKINHIENTNKEVKESFTRYPKEQHLHKIIHSGYFKLAREIVFMSSEESNADKFYYGALSCGSIQTILKTDPSLVENELNSFKKAVNEFFENKTISVDFCYRMRLGIKKG